MARFHCLLAATALLGAHLLPAADEPAPQEREPAYDRKKYDEGNETLRRLIAESIELSKSVAGDQEHGRPVSKETLARLKELHLQIELLEEEQIEETRKFQRAESIKSKKPEAVAAKAPMNPSDAYFQGWLLARDAGGLRAKNNLADSREKLKKAMELFEQIAKEHPDWKPQMVQGRLAKTKEDLSALPSSGD